MDVATQTHLTKLRALLTYRLHELRAEVHAAEQNLREPSGTDEHEVVDRKDDAGQRQRSEVDTAQLQRDLDELAQVEAAMQRLDNGTYGDCADCAQPISLQRLLVQPSAKRCAPCQTAFEHALERAGTTGHRS